MPIVLSDVVTKPVRKSADVREAGQGQANDPPVIWKACHRDHKRVVQRVPLRGVLSSAIGYRSAITYTKEICLHYHSGRTCSSINLHLDKTQ